MTLRLYEYQKKGVEHLLSRPFGLPHALLADEPGTGKTVMAIEAAKQAGCKTGIILCPASIKLQWAKQMEAWGLADPDEIQICEGYRYRLDKRPWVILNYALVRQEEIRQQLFERNWHVLVEDEAHNLKGRDSQQSLAVFHKKYGIGNKCYWKWPMSGSIMPNRPIDLYPILYSHFPQVIYDCLKFKDYVNKFCGGDPAGRGASNIDILTERLQKVMLLRSLRDVWRECPDVVENDVWLDNVPFELHPEWIGYDFMHEPTIRRCVAEAKIPQVVSWVNDRLNSGVKKITLITFHREMTEGLEKGLAKFKPAKIYGGMSPAKREANKARFIEDADCQVIILQIMSAGEGVDGLQKVCNEYVYCEPEWTPGREDQAGRRILRLGQANSVVIETRLYAARSYEEIIYRSNLRKRKVIDVVCKPNGGSFVAQHFEESLAVLARVAAKLEPVLDQFIAQGALSISAPPQANSVGQAVVAPPLPAAPVAAITSLPQANAVPAPAPAIASTPAPLPVAAPVAAALPAAPVVPAAPIPTAPIPAQAPALSAPPVGNVVPFGAPAAAAPSAAVPPAAPVPAATASFAGGMFASRTAFEDAVKEKCKALGVPAGPQKIVELCGTFGVARLGLLPEEHVPNYIAHLNAAIAQAAPAIAQ